MQRSATEAVEAKVAAAAEHQRALLRLHDEVAYREGLQWQERMAVLEQVGVAGCGGSKCWNRGVGGMCAKVGWATCVRRCVVVPVQHAMLGLGVNYYHTNAHLKTQPRLNGTGVALGPAAL